ncbi:MAG: DinB family protein [Candidatus Hydrogenedentes bacterium]|nr:DinB family protein [Candidatus Hydrogenedentota bacterium]
MTPQCLVDQLKVQKHFFDRSTACLLEEHACFAPVEGVMTAAQTVAHVAHTVDWFIEGAFRPEGFNLDFEGMAREIEHIKTMAEAREWLDRAYAAAIAKIGACSMDDLQQPMADGPVMGGMPRLAIVGAMADHAAHHRGALTIYSRLCGLTPEMPYG